jgi:5-methylcytosine-specific restriction endonuclease McrA
MRSDFYLLDPSHVDSRRIEFERKKAREFKKSRWWKNLIAQGRCQLCEKEVGSKELTMDHVIPLARGGRSMRGNLTASCWECNQSKKLQTPVDQILKTMI